VELQEARKEIALGLRQKNWLDKKCRDFGKRGTYNKLHGEKKKGQPFSLAKT